MKEEQLDSLAGLLKEVDACIRDKAHKQVEVEHCINIKMLCDYKVSCSYGDMVFIICILKDYLKLIDDREGEIWDYFRNRFAKLADKLASQIEYDYDKQLEKCMKKMNAKEKDGDIGEDAVILATRHGR